jgi:hypothetical protein
MARAAGGLILSMRKGVSASLMAVAIGGALLARDAIAQELVAFQAPHLARRPAAIADPALGRQIDAQAVATKPSTPEDLVTFALGTTAGLLHFGLGHRTRLAFDATEREGNCVEYAELFSWTFNREHAGVDARAWVVRSDAKVLSRVLPDRAWKDHDWVLVVARTPQGSKRLYVDPTLYDMGFGWDISRFVHGDVVLPS